MSISDYKTTASENNTAGALFPEGMLAKDLNDRLRQLQADLANHFIDNWIQYDRSNVSRTNDDNKKFRISGTDARDVFKKGNIIRINNNVTIVKSATFDGSNTDVEITSPLFTSVLPIYYSLQGNNSVNKPIPITDDHDALKGYIYAKADEYKVCIKDTDDLSDLKWDDEDNFKSIVGLNAKNIRDLGFAQLKVEYESASKQLTFTETKS